MWTEIIFSRDDLAGLLAQAFPFAVSLGAAGEDHSLSLTDLGEVKLVADSGLRIECKARLHWPLLGIDVPIEVRTLTLLLVPAVEGVDDGEHLVLRASLEHIDFAAMPALVDGKITETINAKLAAKEHELSWNFSKSLAYLLPIPPKLAPIESFALWPAWGKVRITDDAIVIAASFHSALLRSGDAVPAQVAARAREDSVPRAPLVPAPSAALARVEVPRPILAAGVFALAAGLAYFLVRRSRFD